MSKYFSKIIFGFPIALFFGVGILVSTDLIQPSYFQNISQYYPYFIFAIFIGYLSLFLASSYIEYCKNPKKAISLAIVYMMCEGLFSYLAIQSYYGNEQIPVIRIISALCLPLIFSLFYFLKIIDSKPVYKTNNEKLNTIFKTFDDIDRNKPKL